MQPSIPIFIHPIHCHFHPKLAFQSQPKPAAAAHGQPGLASCTGLAQVHRAHRIGQVNGAKPAKCPMSQHDQIIKAIDPECGLQPKAESQASAYTPKFRGLPPAPQGSNAESAKPTSQEGPGKLCSLCKSVEPMHQVTASPAVPVVSIIAKIVCVSRPLRSGITLT